jgi:hypothetical protein
MGHRTPSSSRVSAVSPSQCAWSTGSTTGFVSRDRLLPGCCPGDISIPRRPLASSPPGARAIDAHRESAYPNGGSCRPTRAASFRRGRRPSWRAPCRHCDGEVSSGVTDKCNRPDVIGDGSLLGGCRGCRPPETRPSPMGSGRRASPSARLCRRAELRSRRGSAIPAGCAPGGP